MANESFTEFAENLQREIEQETGVKFGILQLSLFSGLTFTSSVTEEKTVSEEDAKIIADYVAALIVPKQEIEDSTDTKPIEVIQPVPLAPVTPPALSSIIEKAVTTAQMGAEVTAEKIQFMTYVETKEVEQTVSYYDAHELLTPNCNSILHQP